MVQEWLRNCAVPRQKCQRDPASGYHRWIQSFSSTRRLEIRQRADCRFHGPV